MKFVAFLSCILLSAFYFTPAVYAATVEPKLYYNNASEQEVYTPTEDQIYYAITGSNTSGPYTAVFNDDGEADPEGNFLFTAVIGTGIGEEYTKLISWSSNFPIEAVIVSGKDALYVYEYQKKIRGDTNLIAPLNASGVPENIDYIALVFDPEELPAGQSIFDSIWGYIIYGSLVLVFFLVGLIFGNVNGVAKKIQPTTARSQYSAPIPSYPQTGLTPPEEANTQIPNANLPNNNTSDRPIPRNPRSRYYNYY